MDFEELKANGNSCFKDGAYSEAISWYNRCISIRPEDPVGYSNKAMALLKDGRSDEAVISCTKGLALITDPVDQKTLKQKLEYRLKQAQENLSKDKHNLVPLTINECYELDDDFAHL